MTNNSTPWCLIVCSVYDVSSITDGSNQVKYNAQTESKGQVPLELPSDGNRDEIKLGLVYDDAMPLWSNHRQNLAFAWWIFNFEDVQNPLEMTDDKNYCMTNGMLCHYGAMLSNNCITLQHFSLGLFHLNQGCLPHPSWHDEGGHSHSHQLSYYHVTAFLDSPVKSTELTIERFYLM